MEYSAHAFVYTLLAGLVWLLVFDIFFGKPIHVVDGYNSGQDNHCGTHEPHTRICECDKGMHDHDMDGIPDDPRNAHFHEQDAAHHHQTGNIISHPGEFDDSHPHHRNQLDHSQLMRYN